VIKPVPCDIVKCLPRRYIVCSIHFGRFIVWEFWHLHNLKDLVAQVEMFLRVVGSDPQSCVRAFRLPVIQLPPLMKFVGRNRVSRQIPVDLHLRET